MFKTFFASAMLFAVTSTHPTPDQTPFPSSFEDDSAFSPILAAQTDVFSEIGALAETEDVEGFVKMLKNTGEKTPPEKEAYQRLEATIHSLFRLQNALS